MGTLKLGSVDKGSKPDNIGKYLATIHDVFSESLKKKEQFRDETQWRSVNEKEDNDVKEIQQFLKDSGFLPNGNVDGIFGYRTRAGVRLFQEYIRSVEGMDKIGSPDGIVGPNTRSFIKWWKDNRTVCDWGVASVENPTPEFTQWMNILKGSHEGYKKEPTEILNMVKKFTKKSDTLPVDKWTFKEEDVHLLGIRRNRNESVKSNHNRPNDDIFILLINGMVFKFWGSCDPSPKSGKNKREDEPYLVEGQHLYKIGWHLRSKEFKTYMALKPANHGVLVFRDDKTKNVNALTDEIVKAGLDGPNLSINIHWTGDGQANFSEGCQVIAGKSYINHRNKVVDCSDFAAPNNAGLKSVIKNRKIGGVTSTEKVQQTKAAYNVLTDLVAVYRTKNDQIIRYSLGRDTDLAKVEGFDSNFAADLHWRMQQI